MEGKKREVSYGVYESPIGPLTIVCTEDGVKTVGFQKENERLKILPEVWEEGCEPQGKPYQKSDEMLDWTIRELEEYFEGKRKIFTVPCVMEGTEFQKKVWTALTEIPYGETRSYKEIAVQTGNPKACRAVGMANHRNPIAIIVPCHRVVGSNGKLTGYAGGIDAKEKLLELEIHV